MRNSFQPQWILPIATFLTIILYTSEKSKVKFCYHQFCCLSLRLKDSYAHSAHCVFHHRNPHPFVRCASARMRLKGEASSTHTPKSIFVFIFIFILTLVYINIIITIFIIIYISFGFASVLLRFCFDFASILLRFCLRFASISLRFCFGFAANEKRNFVATPLLLL